MTPEKEKAKKCQNCQKIEYPEDTEFLFEPEICQCFLNILESEERDEVKAKIEEALKSMQKTRNIQPTRK